jgi:hypothetical protein
VDAVLISRPLKHAEQRLRKLTARKSASRWSLRILAVDRFTRMTDGKRPDLRL